MGYGPAISMQSKLLYVGQRKIENLCVRVHVAISPRACNFNTSNPEHSRIQNSRVRVRHDKVRKFQRIVEKGALRVRVRAMIRFRLTPDGC